MDRIEYLNQLAHDAGYKDVNEYILACEMLYTSRKVGKDLDSAFLPEDLDKYVGSVDYQLYQELDK